MKKKRGLEIKRTAKKVAAKPRWPWGRLALGLAVVAALVTSSWLIAHAERLLIHSVDVQGTKTVDQRAVAAAALEVLEGNYGWLYPKRHSWWYAPEAVLAIIRERFPELETVELSPAADGQLAIKVTERQGKYLWCADYSGADCVFLDGSGILFAAAPAYSGHLFFEFGVATSTAPILGQTLLPPADFQALLEFRERLSEVLEASPVFASLHPYRVEALTERDYRLLVEWPTDLARPDFELRFSLSQAPEAVARQLRSVLASPNFIAEFETAGTLEYLDLRFLPKVFYRFTGQSDAAWAIMSRV